MVSLHDWQQRALDYANTKNKALIQCATGTGKTYFATQWVLRLLKQYPETRILIIVPKIVILEQVWLRELSRAGIPPNKIGMYYMEAREYSTITLTTNASVTKINTELFDHVIIDEIHNFNTTRLEPVLKKDWKTLIGLSATIMSSNHEHWKLLARFGFDTFEYDAGHAMKDEIISTMDFINVPVEFKDETLRERYEELTKEVRRLSLLRNLAGATNTTGIRMALYAANNERNQIVYEYEDKLKTTVEIIKRHPRDKIIVFNQRNAVSTKLWWMLTELGVKAVVVNSRVPKQQRASNLASFAKGEARVLLASISLDEGANVPDANVAIILSGSNALRQVVQRAGRVLRKTGQKHHAILYQVFLKDTTEEKHARQRAKYFKSISLTNVIIPSRSFLSNKP